MLYNECLNYIKRRNEVIFPAIGKIFQEAGYPEEEAGIFATSLIDTVRDFILACGNLTDSDEKIRIDALDRLFDDMNRYCFPDIRLFVAEKFGFATDDSGDSVYIETPDEEKFRKTMLEFGKAETVPYEDIPACDNLLSLYREAAKQFVNLKTQSKQTHNIEGLKPTAMQIYVLTTVNSLTAELKNDNDAVKMIRGIGMLHISAYAVGYGKRDPEDLVKLLEGIKNSNSEKEKEVLKYKETLLNIRESAYEKKTEDIETAQQNKETEEEEKATETES